MKISIAELLCVAGAPAGSIDHRLAKGGFTLRSSVRIAAFVGVVVASLAIASGAQAITLQLEGSATISPSSDPSFFGSSFDFETVIDVDTSLPGSTTFINALTTRSLRIDGVSLSLSQISSAVTVFEQGATFFSPAADAIFLNAEFDTSAATQTDAVLENFQIELLGQTDTFDNNSIANVTLANLQTIVNNPVAIGGVLRFAFQDPGGSGELSYSPSVTRITDVAAIPLPAGLPLLAGALGSFVLLRRRVGRASHG